APVPPAVRPGGRAGLVTPGAARRIGGSTSARTGVQTRGRRRGRGGDGGRRAGPPRRQRFSRRRGVIVSYLVGKIVLDVVAGAPNNGMGEDNVARVKQLRVGRNVHPYVSAQAFGPWLRDSLPASEPVSPVVRSGSGRKQQACTLWRPVLYFDYDLFGYMVAVTGVKTKICQRDTVLATGTFVSVAPR